MSITASRLGHSPITLDWSNLINVRASDGPTGGTTWAGKPDVEACSHAWNQLKSRFAAGEVGFYETPVSDILTAAQESETLARQILECGNFTDCLVLGIGGSALGPISMLDALREKQKTSIRFHFMENPDPVDCQAVFRSLHPENTLVCAITKSGTTFETMAQLLIAMDWLGAQRIQKNLIAITDPNKGDLRELVRKTGIKSLPIHPSIGGRFSIFSPVGLFPAALAGLSLSEFLKGAQEVRDWMEKTPLEKNPFCILATELIRHFEKRPIHVCMPYATRLRSVGSWFVQLWAESLGKNLKGFTPLSALGATDQHSILQLLRDGPDDKITWFITVDRVENPMPIPRNILASQTGVLPSLQCLEGHTLQNLLKIEYQAIAKVMTRASRPHITWSLDTLDERNLGALYFAWSVLTAFTGMLWDVNPFDQPGVEEGKIYIKESLAQKEETR